LPASDRAASLVTLPFNVTTPLFTLAWIGWPASAESDEMRLCAWLVSVASSVAGCFALQPASTMASADPRTMLRVVKTFTVPFINSFPAGCSRLKYYASAHLIGISPVNPACRGRTLFIV
jgi:hypothetical protein